MAATQTFYMNLHKLKGIESRVMAANPVSSIRTTEHSKVKSFGNFHVKANPASTKSNGTEESHPSKMLDLTSNPEMLNHPFGNGKLVGKAFQQNFSIRSFEIGPDKFASPEALMNHLQESALNHVKAAGILVDGFGTTSEMFKQNLVWVLTGIRVILDRYPPPTWGDVVQVETTVSESGKNGMRRDWVLRDMITHEILARASSVWFLMNKITRKLSKMPQEVRGEIEPYFINSDPVVQDDKRKIPTLDDTAEHIRTGLRARWSDLDVNQHVNNVKYIAWILESIPESILESHQLHFMALEYRSECSSNTVLESLTSVSGADADIGNLAGGDLVECRHLLRREDGAAILKGRTEWMLKDVNHYDVLNQAAAQSVE